MSLPACQPAPELAKPSANLPEVTLIVPIYNEADQFEANYLCLTDYLATLSGRFAFRILYINDGSGDGSRELLQSVEQDNPIVEVIHHHINQGLNAALMTGFANVKTRYAVTLDADLSYSPDHIERLLDRLISRSAHLVLASPYMKGGRTTAVPFDRHLMSRAANWFLGRIAPERLHTLTGMVRAYDMEFLRGVDLKASSMDINPEIIYKTLLLRGKVEEIPAHLDWSSLRAPEQSPRRRSFGFQWNTLAILFSGFLFRPFLFFLVPGLLMLLIAMVCTVIALAHIPTHFDPTVTGSFLDQLKFAIDSAYDAHGYAFVGTGILLILAVQLLTLGVMSMQSKRYFEELFHLGTTVYRSTQKLSPNQTTAHHASYINPNEAS
ncbi:MAG: glycosyltransferase family 2 protein [Verrucomicrobiota bacterium]